MLQRNNNISGLGKRTTDPYENKTWAIAKKLGVAQELNLASEDVRRDFANGVKNAANVVKFKNLDTDHPDVLKYTESLIKKSLAEPIQDETPWVQAMEDAKIALSNSKAKVYQSPSLKSYIKLRQSSDHRIDDIRYRTQSANENQNELSQLIQEKADIHKKYPKDYSLEPKLDKEPYSASEPSEFDELHKEKIALNQYVNDYDMIQEQEPKSDKDPYADYLKATQLADINKGYVYYDITESSPKYAWVDIAGKFSLVGFDLSSALLMHSLQDDPSDLYFGDDSEVVQMIQADENFLSYLDEVMDEHKGEQEFTVDMKGFTFDDNDLYFGIHGVTGEQSTVTGIMQNDGTYSLQFRIVDTYDFDRLKEIDDFKDFVIDSVLREAVADQKIDIIQTYDILIEFDIMK